MQEVNWEFDMKDQSVSQKMGNISTPTMIKLCSKYNKGAKDRVDNAKIAETFVKELNKRLEDEESGYTLVHSEVLKFDHLNGFVNIFL